MAVQTLLQAKGINPPPADGVCDAKTIAAIRKFQSSAMLNADGLVSPNGPIWARLSSPGAASKPSPLPHIGGWSGDSSQWHCPNAGAASAEGDAVVFECAREQAANHLLHSVHAFDSSGQKLIDIEHCRKPRWAAQRTIVCDAESVDAAGRLKYPARRFDFPKSRHKIARPATAGSVAAIPT